MAKDLAGHDDPQAHQPLRTHYCEWDAPGGQLVRTLCGVLIQRRAHRNEPTCLACRTALDKREKAIGPA